MAMKEKALIIGSSRGIGRGIAEQLLDDGYDVIITGRDRHQLEKTYDEILESYDGDSKLQYYLLDALEEAQVEKLSHWEGLNNLNHLICNVGSGKSVPYDLEGIVEWKRMLDINLNTSRFSVEYFLPLLKNSAINKKTGSTITFISSICGLESLDAPIAYSVAKSAVIAYANNIARKLANSGIRVNCVSPGNILFPGSTWDDKLKNDKEAIEALIEKSVPMGRFGTINEVANAVTFLLSTKASFITGANLVVDGGQTRTI